MKLSKSSKRLSRIDQEKSKKLDSQELPYNYLHSSPINLCNFDDNLFDSCNSKPDIKLEKDMDSQKENIEADTLKASQFISAIKSVRELVSKVKSDNISRWVDFASKTINQLYPLLTEEDIIKVMIYRLPKEENEYMVMYENDDR